MKPPKGLSMLYEQGDELSINIKRVMADIREGKDIKGSILVKGGHAVIVSDLPEDTDTWMEEDEILDMIHEWKGSLPLTSKNTMFPEFIKDYNGCKILAKWLMDDLTLLVVTQRTGYLGLAMLEVESSIQRAQRLMKENELQNYQE
ncbi:MAG: hypothetical protein JSW28_05625 [Thermoplasmata archaeon]|nr:MAG: hypothetical protein JSW28_05625 [Thermoplasmata archaeon]